jgi:hypothetical protein
LRDAEEFYESDVVAAISEKLGIFSLHLPPSPESVVIRVSLEEDRQRLEQSREGLEEGQREMLRVDVW